MEAETHGPKATKTDNSIKGEVAGGSFSDSGKSKLGVGVSTSGSGQLVTGELKKGFDGKLSVKHDKEGNLDSVSVFDAYVSAKGSVASGEAEASYGAASVKGEGQVLTGEVKANGKAKLYENGKFAPQLSAEVKASGDIAKGSVTGSVGSDKNNIHATAKGEVGHAEAYAGAGLGKITYEDSDGNVKTGYGAYAEAGAEAYAVKGTLGGGLTFLGIKIDASVDFKAGGAGAKAGGEVTTGGLKGGLSLGALVGLGVNVSIDWSGFEWPKFNWFGSDKKKKDDSKKSGSSSGGGGGPAKIYVYPDQIRGEAEKLQSVSKEMDSISSEVAHVRDSLHLKGAAAVAYRQKLAKIIVAIKNEKKKADRLSDSLEDIAKLYTDTETKIASI